jgi:hypothetical protein
MGVCSGSTIPAFSRHFTIVLSHEDITALSNHSKISLNVFKNLLLFCYQNLLTTLLNIYKMDSTKLHCFMRFGIKYLNQLIKYYLFLPLFARPGARIQSMATGNSWSSAITSSGETSQKNKLGIQYVIHLKVLMITFGDYDLRKFCQIILILEVVPKLQTLIHFISPYIYIVQCCRLFWHQLAACPGIRDK